MTIIFANNALSKLAQPLSSGQTVLTIQSGTGALFPSPSGGDYFKLTVEDRRTQQIEVMHCIGRAGDDLTVVRAREDMIAQSFLEGATVSNRFTRDTPEAILNEVPNPNPLYLGAFASNPTTDNDGNPLQTGMFYFNTGNTRLWFWTGGSWVDPIGSNNITTSSGVFVLQDVSGDFDGVETQFDLRYTDYAAMTQTPDVVIAEQFIIHLDGVPQRPGTDYIIQALGVLEFLEPPVADALFHGVWIALTSGLPGDGTGDMTRAVYDMNNNGVVDAAETVQFGGISNVPTKRWLARLTAGTGMAEAVSTAAAQDELLKEFGLPSQSVSSVAGVLDIDFEDGTVVDILVEENITDINITNWPTAPRYGRLMLKFTMDGTGGWDVVLPSPPVWIYSNGAPPTITSTPNAVDWLVLMTMDGGTTVFTTVAGQDYS